MENIEIEEQIISVVLNNNTVLKEYNVDEKFFDEGNHLILSGIKYAFNNDVQLTRQTYKDFLTTYKKMTPQEIASQIILFNRCLMKGAKKDDLPMLLDRAKESYIRRRTTTSFSEYKTEREKLGDIGANRALIDKLSNIEVDISDTKVNTIYIGSEKENYMKALQQRRLNPGTRLTCGIEEIDETMSVGFKVGHLTLFCSDVGSYKTTVMVNVGVNIFKRCQENILFIPLEMPSDEIMNKIVSRETRIPMSLIEHADKLSEEQIKEIAAELDKWQGLSHRFSIMDLSERAKLSTIRREIEKRISYFKPRVVIIDYADNIVPDYTRGSRSDLEMNDTLEDMRKMGKVLGFSVISAAQLGRDALKRVREQKEGKQQLGSTDVRGGQVMTANSDTVYAQLRDPSQPNDKLIFFCIKSRHGQSTFKNKQDKTILNVRPEICLIESPRDIAQVDSMIEEIQNKPHNVPGDDDPWS